MKYLHSLLLLVGFGSPVFSQITENFDSGLPAGWTQSGSAGFTWVVNATQGTSGSGCVMVDQSAAAESGTAKLETPFLDLSQQTTPELTFSSAGIRNNFMPPTFKVWYNTGSGWVLLSEPESQMSNADFEPPLDDENITWETLTVSLATIATNNHVRIAIEADFSNGGWALLDNVSIEGTPSTVGLEEQEIAPTIHLYPNPATDQLFVSSETPVQALTLHTMDGKVIQQIDMNAFNGSIDLRHLKGGTYFITVLTGEGSRSVSFIVQE